MFPSDTPDNPFGPPGDQFFGGGFGDQPPGDRFGADFEEFRGEMAAGSGRSGQDDRARGRFLSVGLHFFGRLRNKE